MLNYPVLRVPLRLQLVSTIQRFLGTHVSPTIWDAPGSILKTYQAAFPRLLPIVIIRRDDIVVTILDVVRSMHGAIYCTVPDFGDQSNLDEPGDNLFSMVIKRGISSWNRPFTLLGAEIAISPVLLGNMLYEAKELNFFNYVVNVFLELLRLPGPTLQEPIAMYTGTFILKVMNHVHLIQEHWDELSKD
ncbi:hypothetical protein K503DRAFT_371998 [Rhizopogon vinicolor AM-OR11-026]|uniref:Uncharacterized protein n=1 Tax=Rhizopogon vinicolor AM-OR11-026 TaxID=1314800 RepID=A0A1B7MRY8_9AGAM|nr:hypothetical protein K503DRAFT_371998 [Rhizopogon vinicolor AM-OR11-026]